MKLPTTILRNAVIRGNVILSTSECNTLSDRVKSILRKLLRRSTVCILFLLLTIETVDFIYIFEFSNNIRMGYLSCAKCCTLFSITGIIFLVIIGSLLQTQPLYIKGPRDHRLAAKGCFQGALLYLVTLLLSVGYWLYESLRKKPVQSERRFGTSPNPSSGNLETTRFGGKYGAVVTDTFD